MSGREPDITSPPFNGARLARRRLAAFRTQAELAHEVGVTLRQLQRWEAGTSDPQFRFVRALATALGVEPAWFYGPNDDTPTEAAA
ncbi:MAG TPA: helix-turn-helix transcriptional regulator [Gaiellales bacterium]|nr:helix-turn-helix transcriptional regulator [Gaiellales bacterium]